jgi:signal recognition particle subunit SRP54
LKRRPHTSDEKNAEKLERKGAHGASTLDDFLEQMQQLKKMGPLAKRAGHAARRWQQAEGCQDQTMMLMKKPEAIIRQHDQTGAQTP